MIDADITTALARLDAHNDRCQEARARIEEEHLAYAREAVGLPFGPLDHDGERRLADALRERKNREPDWSLPIGDFKDPLDWREMRADTDDRGHIVLIDGERTIPSDPMVERRLSGLLAEAEDRHEADHGQATNPWCASCEIRFLRSPYGDNDLASAGWTESELRESAQTTLRARARATLLRTRGVVPDATPADPETVETLGGSWAAQDLTDVLDGTFEPTVPCIFEREDGQALFYAGMVHSMHGESESGKSLVAQWACAIELQMGESVVYIDYESDREEVVGRLLMMGCSKDSILDGFTYVHPEEDPAADRANFEALLRTKPSLVIIDGVTDSLGLAGLSSMDNDDLARWSRNLPRRIAKRTGAAVVLIDHVTKSTEGRGRFALGGQAKMSGLDGAAYTVDVISPAGKGRFGRLSLRIAKDRPGGIRGACGEPRKSDRTQEAAIVVIDGTVDGQIGVRVKAPDELADPAVIERRHQSKAAGIMRNLIDEIEAHPGSTKNALIDSVKGNKEEKSTALRSLIEDGYVRVDTGARNAHHHHIGDKPFAITPDLLPTIQTED
ncbi:hypothetical protein ASG73_04410 [Janibacter sp. Soil728]|uniref:AAA family ATPase n=1 Tax=Janibacter sp. Soil728 TaxID=1736393 RepID=UPI000701D963|nr:AAA family ATPase [Janibacter sp. Soil728]KRE38211.1 hypothetical protein ASG73_04410 [Janibacter sp. Soil728]